MKRTFLSIALFLPSLCFGQGQNFPGGGSGGITSVSQAAPSTAYTLFPATSSACTTYSASGTNYCAVNNQTGVISTNTDIRALWDTVVAASPNGGRFFWKNGVYNCNSLDQESTGGYSPFYCIGIPGGGPNQYASWVLEGESAITIIDQFDSTPPQTNGVVLNLTTTAENSVAANSKIMIIWARPDTVNNVGPVVFEKNLTLRVPTNQRGCETASALFFALSTDYENVYADTNVSEASLVLPTTASCVAWGENDGGGYVGLTTSNSSKQIQWMRRVATQGAYVGMDLRSEHTVLEHAGAVRGFYGFRYGQGGGTVFHSFTGIEVACGELKVCFLLGNQLAQGSQFNILSIDIELATATAFPTFQTVAYFQESNLGFTCGQVNYSLIQANVGVFHDAFLFNVVGAGSCIQAIQATVPYNFVRGAAVDTFARNNSASIGPPWGNIGASINGCTIASNSAVPSSGNCGNAWNGQIFANDQFSQATINTIDASGLNVIVRSVEVAFAGAANYYDLRCTTGGRTLRKIVAGTPSTLASDAVACATTHVMKVDAIGNTVSGYYDGVRILTAQDSTFTTGQPGFFIGATGDSFTNWSGGAYLLADSTKSIYGSTITAPTYNTLSNCAVNSVSPAACGSAAAGAFVDPATTTTYVVNTTAVTAASRINITAISFAGNLPSAPTCTVPSTPFITTISAISPGVSFTLTLPSSAGQTCWQYQIIN